MREEHHANPQAQARGREAQTPKQPGGRVGLRGCWELLIKLIILLILILILLAYWFGLFGPFGPRGQYNPWAWFVLLLLIALLIWLIWRQKHFVMLNCDLTQPTGCKHGDTEIVSGRVLERITGTASGLGFARYELELVYGATVIPAGIVYADGGGMPDTTPPFGNHQVTSGTLGFVDIQQAVAGAGAGFLTSTTFEVRLRVIGIDGSTRLCIITFDIASARSFIKRVGAAWAHNYVNPDEPLCRVAPPVGHPISVASVGGNISVKGSANVYGCAAEKIAEVHMWAVPDDGFAFPQPNNGDAIVAPPGSQKISEVLYSNDLERNNNRLDATTDEGVTLTFNPGWTTRLECVSFFPPICWNVPDIVERTWFDPTGKYTLLLAVKDTAGHTYFDIQRVWLDNDMPKALITSIGGLSGCLDLKLSDFRSPATCVIRGQAWDRAIRAADAPDAVTAGHPNDNFGGYKLTCQKNGVAASALIIPPFTTNRVPNTWADSLAAAAEDVLAQWNIVGAIDGGSSPGPHQLARTERCAYIIRLEVSDTTLRAGGNTVAFNYAINIINDL